MSIANSPLVKTAIAGEDANWGRVVMAVGKAGEPAERDRLSISFGGIRVAKRASAIRPMTRPKSPNAMKPKIQISIDLGLGKAATGSRPAISPRNMSRSTAITAHDAGKRQAELKLVLVVACALIDADRRVLLAQRPEGKAMAGLWEFPGGKIEPGERPEETLIRELHEELGITVEEACLAPLTFASHAYERFHLLMPL